MGKEMGKEIRMDMGTAIRMEGNGKKDKIEPASCGENLQNHEKPCPTGLAERLTGPIVTREACFLLTMTRTSNGFTQLSRELPLSSDLIRDEVRHQHAVFVTKAIQSRY